jgi:geranylgeranyl diphosphate synthase type II
MSPGALVKEVLADYGGTVRARMMRYLPQGEPQHWLYGPMADYPRRGGRGLRPTICVATARAFGAPVEDAVLTAVSIELMHNAMLIHDDIQDESEERRGQPALHHKIGLPLALNAGDALALFAMRPLLDNVPRLGPELSMRLLEETVQMARESAEGQAVELGWRRDNHMTATEADYLEMVLKKTCWLATIHPLRTGALIGAGTAAPVEALTKAGFFLGAAFQIQDDLLNLVGDADRYGKELAGDIYEGKRTLMIIHLIEQGSPEEVARLERLLATPRAERAAEEVRWVRARMEHHGCLEYARQVAHGLAGAARHELSRLLAALPESRDTRFLLTLPEWVIARA